MSEKKSSLLVGRIGAAYGVKGWLKVSSYTDPPENIFSYKPWQLRNVQDENSFQTAELIQGKPHGKGLVVQLAGIADRNEAERFTGLEIHVERELLPDPDDGHFYWADLKGLRVENSDGVTLGQVQDLLDTGSADVMVVTGEQRYLIPFIMADTVIDVDLEAGCIRVDWTPVFE